MPRPKTVGGLVLLTSGTTGTPKGASRQVSSPFAAAQFLDRVPLGIERAHLLRRAAVPRHRPVAVPAHARARLDDHHPAQVRPAQDARDDGRVQVRDARTRPDDAAAHARAWATKRSRSTTRARCGSSSCAGSALAPEVGNHAMELFGDVVYNLYGSTEVAVASVATPADWKKAPGTVGKVPVGLQGAHLRRGRQARSPSRTLPAASSSAAD